MRNQNKPNTDLIYGKVPPQARELETAILGAIMLEKSAIERVEDILRPECFYTDEHQRVFRACMSLKNTGRPIDMMTVIEELKRTEELDLAGGPYAVSKLTNQVTSAANIEYHSAVVFDKWRQRELIRIGGQLMSGAYEDSFNYKETISELEKDLTGLSGPSGSAITIGQAISESLNRLEGLRQQASHITGIPSGYPDIDRVTHGWQNTDLIILAARPSVGKTAFALNLIRNAALNESKPTSVGFFSLEMSTGQVTNRMIAAESGIPLDNIQNGQNVSDSQMQGLYGAILDPMSRSKIIIDDTGALSITDLRARARRMKRKNNIGMIVIDYLQLMSGDNTKGNREQEISKISRDLKALAKELQIPIIALSQLSRELEKRGGQSGAEPKLSDLRESGAIEQDADMVMFLYRPEYHGITANEMGESTKGLTKLSIAKHRNGSLAIRDEVIKLEAKLHIQKFIPWSGSVAPGPLELGSGNWKPVNNELFKGDEPMFP